MLLVDTLEKSLIQDVELKSKIARSRPHSQWLQEQVNKLTIIYVIYIYIIYFFVFQDNCLIELFVLTYLIPQINLKVHL